MNDGVWNEEVCGRIMRLAPADQLDAVFNQDHCDIGPEFLGFVGIYDHLAQIVPTHWTIVDLGCAYAPQALLFTNHAAYIGVDIFDGERFSAPNTKHYIMPIEDFIKSHLSDFDLSTTFAICSYVPPWGGDNIGRVRRAFHNVFTYYPAGGPNPFKAMQEKWASKSLETVT